MFDENDKQNLEIAKKCLSEVLTSNLDELNGYNAAVFKLKQSLELLGTLRDKGNDQQNALFKKISYLRNSLVHGVAVLNSHEYIQQIKGFITNDIPLLMQQLDNLQPNYNLGNTQLYKSIARTSKISNTTPNAENIKHYVETFNVYVEILRNIDLNTKDQYLPIRKLAALNAILTLGEITKQVSEKYPEKLEQFPYLPRIQIFSSSARNPLAHAKFNLELSDIKGIQDQLKQDLNRSETSHSEVSGSGSISSSYQGKLKQLGEQMTVVPSLKSTAKPKARLKKRSREEEDLLASQQAATEWEQQQGSIVTTEPHKKKNP